MKEKITVGLLIALWITVVGWRVNGLRKSLLQRDEPERLHKQSSEVILIFGFPLVAIVGGIFVVISIALIVGFYQAFTQLNLSVVPFFIIVGIGLIVAIIGTWRILTYDPPLERGKRKRKRKFKLKEKPETVISSE
jgi:hypothetical protein